MVQRRAVLFVCEIRARSIIKERQELDWWFLVHFVLDSSPSGLNLIRPNGSYDAFAESFVRWSICKWNSLPDFITSIEDSFKEFKEFLESPVSLLYATDLVLAIVLRAVQPVSAAWSCESVNNICGSKQPDNGYIILIMYMSHFSHAKWLNYHTANHSPTYLCMSWSVSLI